MRRVAPTIVLAAGLVTACGSPAPERSSERRLSAAAASPSARHHGSLADVDDGPPTGGHDDRSGAFALDDGAVESWGVAARSGRRAGLLPSSPAGRGPARRRRRLRRDHHLDR